MLRALDKGLLTCFKSNTAPRVLAWATVQTDLPLAEKGAVGRADQGEDTSLGGHI